jgi:hypothetical protein
MRPVTAEFFKHAIRSGPRNRSQNGLRNKSDSQKQKTRAKTPGLQPGRYKVNGKYPSQWLDEKF